MTAKTIDVISMAVSLPLEDRNIVVEKLLDSMYPDQKEIDDLWRVEVQRRVEEVRSGKVKLIPGEQVFQEIRERFEK